MIRLKTIMSYFKSWSGWSRLAKQFRLGCTLVQCITHSMVALWSTRRPKLPQPRVNLIDMAAPLSIHSSSVGTAIREAWMLALAEHVRDCQSQVTSQIQLGKGASAHHILDISHLEAGCWGWFIQLDHSSVILGPLIGNLSSSTWRYWRKPGCIEGP